VLAGGRAGLAVFAGGRAGRALAAGGGSSNWSSESMTPACSSLVLIRSFIKALRSGSTLAGGIATG
jgi:hypothetical protein